MLHTVVHVTGNADINPRYLDNHAESACGSEFLNEHMRATAIVWMVEVCKEKHLEKETLFLAVALLDRYLTCTRVSAGGCTTQARRAASYEASSQHAATAAAGRLTQYAAARGGHVHPARGQARGERAGCV